MTRIGIDTGGTFTDLLLLDEGGMRVHKLRSMPAEPSQAILAGIRELVGEAGMAGLEITHGSTVATNALLERKGARIALLATAGFEDVLLIGRQTRAELYNFMVEARRPLVQPGMTFGVRERLAADGSVVTPLEENEVERLVEAVRGCGAEAVAVCLLHCYINADHERMLAERLRAEGLPVSVSHEILPAYREFERWATTAVNAYVTPLMASYLTRLREGLPAASSLRIMQSNGGSISAEFASQAAVQTILSGPAAGVVGAQAVAEESGFPQIISFDMGGTSTDVSLIDGAIGSTSESVVGDFPVRLPVLDIHTVGAGGGSVAYVDAGGSLRVGPRSAGADPGPACYGKGDELTVTDANLLLGRIEPQYFLGGRMTLDEARAMNVARAMARQLGLTVRALAEGVVRIANSNMERAIRVVSVQRGFDPRRFALFAFGGAGGLHGCDLATSLDMETVLIPRYSGVLSALGMLLADVTRDSSASLLKPAAEISEAELRRLFIPLEERLQAELQGLGFRSSDILLKLSLDMRYRGQAYEIPVPFTPDFREAFHRAHQKLYGYANPARVIEIVQLRLRARGRTEKPALTPAHGPVEPQPASQPETVRKVIFGGRAHATPVFQRERLEPGMHGEGPAMVITGESTNLITPSFRWHLDAPGTLVATRKT